MHMPTKVNAVTRSKCILLLVLFASTLSFGAARVNAALSAHECASLASLRWAQERIALHRQVPSSQTASEALHSGPQTKPDSANNRDYVLVEGGSY
jgi:hypothetical protein